MIWLAWLALASAVELYPVQAGDTVASIAEELGTPDLAQAIREANGLTEEPVPGDILRLPARDGVIEQVAFLVSVSGQAEVTHQGARTDAGTFESLPAGAVICTAERSFATVRLATECTADGAKHDDIHLYPSTCMTIEASTAGPDQRSTVVNVSQGGVSVMPNAGGSGAVAVVTDSGVTTGEQGGYRVTVEDQATRTEALAAPVAVAGAGEEVRLETGQGSRVEQGKAPSAPIDLLLPGTPRLPVENGVLRRPSFSWEPVDMAMGYRLEIATGPDFADLVFQEDVPHTELQPDLLMLPFRVPGLWWRVASFDRFGFLGVPSDPRALRVPHGVGP